VGVSLHEHNNIILYLKQQNIEIKTVNLISDKGWADLILPESKITMIRINNLIVIQVRLTKTCVNNVLTLYGGVN
jgi:hypothetical protein